jgi:hypothetical protein
MTGLEWHARLHQWQFFATLTFRDPLPSYHARRRMVYAFLREVAKGPKLPEAQQQPGHFRLAPVPWKALKWLLRGEKGEITGRDHFHALYAGLPAQRQNLVEVFTQKHLWEELGGGSARIYLYDPRLPGVSYVMKGLQEADRAGANAYELTKFREEGEREVILSDSLARRWARPFGGQGRRGAHASLKTQPCDSPSKKGTPRGMACIRKPNPTHPADAILRLHV